jgi:hypothetical protein
MCFEERNMSKQNCAFALSIAAFLAAGGCPRVPDLPEEFEVALTAAEQRTALRNTGPEQFSGMTLEVIRTGPADDAQAAGGPAPGPYGGLLNGGLLERPPVGERMFLVEFDATGAAAQVRENRYVLGDIYGETINIGDAWVGTTVPGISFRSSSYGVTEGERFGLAIIAQVEINGLYAGRAVIYSWGTQTETGFDGQFGYLLDFSGGVGELLFDSGGDQYPVRATRVD